MVEMETMLQNDAKVKFDTVKTFAYSGLIAKELNLKSAAEKFNSNDEIVKAAFDHTFRIYMMENMHQMSANDIKRVLDLAVLAVQKKLCMLTTPIFIINDLLSSLTIEKCAEVFCYLEDNSHIWKSVYLVSSQS